MNANERFLIELRYRPAFQALIPADAYMGIPVKLKGSALYLPFFKPMGKNRCRLDSELVIGYPSGEVYEYKKARKDVCLEYEERELLECKQALSGKDGWPESCQGLPQGFAAVYRHAMEERKDDEYPISV